MNATSKSLYERALRVSPGGVHSPVRSFRSVGRTPVFFRGARGATLTSVEGRIYIDLCQSFGPLIHGHRDPDVSAIVEETLGLAWSLGACEPWSLELAEWVVSRLPWVDKIRFVSTGTEATLSVLRVARAATGRNAILKFEGCYHGHVDSLLVQAGSGLGGRAVSSSAGVSPAVAAETIVCPLDDEASLVEIFARRGSEIAAVIIEPLPANNGLLVQRREFLETLVETARVSGSLVIFDEVISGFRVAPGGMTSLLGLWPDLVCFGKVLGGGFPLGAYGGRADLMDLVAPAGPVYQAGTLSANPIAVRAGLATLQKLEATGAHETLERKGEAFCGELNRRFAARGVPMTAAWVGSIVWLHVAVDRPIRRADSVPEAQAGVFPKLFHAALERGVYLPPSGHEVAFLSTAHDDALLERAVEALDAAAGDAHA